jgi:hypothetical protein
VRAGHSTTSYIPHKLLTRIIVALQIGSITASPSADYPWELAPYIALQQTQRAPEWAMRSGKVASSSMTSFGLHSARLRTTP